MDRDEVQRALDSDLLSTPKVKAVLASVSIAGFFAGSAVFYFELYNYVALILATVLLIGCMLAFYIYPDE